MKKNQIVPVRKVELAKARAAGIDEDLRLRIVRMAMLGFSNKAMIAHLGITQNQIYKSQKWANVRKADYRDAISPIGKEVARRLEDISDTKLVKNLARILLK
jgi:hypothetical protein